ncbi:hypothetical protein HOP50_13g69700 [Chloropicon primus]|uniref:Uncharacterized protein n=1 Tax=Chloropicon primus TaxID=1764295 RepID=A0A5B8MY00_9CHLO|nr:hypothetical protein A3770_13p69500 [Chloropicon primus]UPR03640.1 hypothetical protein HOP50_13g69700 [Chloropicon primus]|mmetsp:Transcript_9357/g.26613  ORF Transcript_9357/g.26613 Transcript_9357/m.26613 type:complete len:93 (-) Transcript_9357:3884-4162(-)|eukprot:QDZ24432.1 hypothetical protein A3770_13p69500 [Chloropicon primus]
MDMEHYEATGCTVLGAMYKKVESIWPGNYYVVGWVFAAAGVAQVAVAAGVGAWRMIRRRREAGRDAAYAVLPGIPETCASRLGEEDAIAVAA